MPLPKFSTLDAMQRSEADLVLSSFEAEVMGTLEKKDPAFFDHRGPAYHHKLARRRLRRIQERRQGLGLVAQQAAERPAGAVIALPRPKA
jgi:hypothetical protein